MKAGLLSSSLYYEYRYLYRRRAPAPAPALAVAFWLLLSGWWLASTSGRGMAVAAFPIGSRATTTTTTNDSERRRPTTNCWPVLRVASASSASAATSSSSLHATLKFKSYEGMLGELHQKEPLLLVYFYKDLCGPCRLQRRELNGIAARLPKVLAIDVEKWPHLGTRYNIGCLPCVLMIRHGQEVDRWEGLTLSHDLLERVAAFQTTAAASGAVVVVEQNER
jgi:thiol-disulfide isomerase/thioredoxin